MKLDWVIFNIFIIVCGCVGVFLWVFEVLVDMWDEFDFVVLDYFIYGVFIVVCVWVGEVCNFCCR